MSAAPFAIVNFVEYAGPQDLCAALAASEARVAQLLERNGELTRSHNFYLVESANQERRAEAAEQSLAEALKDAARYWWLRDNVWAGWMQAEGFYLNCDEPETEWDAAIDALLSTPELPGPQQTPQG